MKTFEKWCDGEALTYKRYEGRNGCPPERYVEGYQKYVEYRKIIEEKNKIIKEKMDRGLRCGCRVTIDDEGNRSDQGGFTCTDKRFCPLHGPATENTVVEVERETSLGTYDEDAGVFVR